MIKNNILYFYNFIFSYIRKIKNYGFLKFNFFFLFNLFIYFKTFYKRKSFLDKKEVLKVKRSNTLFIFGSGYSLNELKEENWRYFEKNDTLGFNHFLKQKWIKLSFHLIRGWTEGFANTKAGIKGFKEINELISYNKLYKNTVFIIQNEIFATIGNTFINKKEFGNYKKIYPYKTEKKPFPNILHPHRFCHHNSTLFDALSFAYIMKWKKIVLVGVDLYDTRYFFLEGDETLYTDYKTGVQKPSKYSDRNQRFDKNHSTYNKLFLEKIELWKMRFEEEGLNLYVYNPKSLLRKVLPIYKT